MIAEKKIEIKPEEKASPVVPIEEKKEAPLIEEDKKQEAKDSSAVQEELKNPEDSKLGPEEKEDLEIDTKELVSSGHPLVIM